MTTPEKLTLRQLLTVFMRSGHPGGNDVHDTLAGGINCTYTGLHVLHPRQDDAEAPGPGAAVHLSRLQAYTQDHGDGWRISTRILPGFKAPEHISTRFCAVIGTPTRGNEGTRVREAGASAYEAFLAAYYRAYIGDATADYHADAPTEAPASILINDLEDALHVMQRYVAQAKDRAAREQ